MSEIPFLDGRLHVPDGAERLHVMPVDDSAEHRDSMDCWCHPTPDAEEPRVIVHHSADGRELSEARP